MVNSQLSPKQAFCMLIIQPASQVIFQHSMFTKYNDMDGENADE